MKPDDSNAAPQLEMAHVLFIDMVEYSTLPTDRQQEALRHLQDAVRETSDFGRAEATEDLVRLPTGDGIALVFFHDPAAPARCALELARNLRKFPEIRLRAGIHSGPVYRMADINANRNVAGGGINIAQRVMNCGDAGHILVSGASAEVLCQISTWCRMLHDLGEVEVKHGVRVHLFNLYSEDAGNPAAPLAVTRAPLGTMKGIRGGRSMAMSYAIVTTLVVGAGAWMGRIGLPGKGAAAAVDPTHRNELVVLPMNSAGSDADTAAFGNGLIETVTTSLAQSTPDRPLLVVPASETRGKSIKTLDQARQELGATMGLVVNVEREGDWIRVNFELIDAKDHKILAADKVTELASDPFKLQDKVADRVLGALRIQMSPADKKALAGQGTTKPGAYDYYLQGRGYLQDFDQPAKVESAITEFRLALDQDPNYAQAYAGLGEAYWRKYRSTRDTALVSDAKDACKHAVRLRADQAAGYNCIGLLDDGTGAYEDAVTQFQKAAALDPTDAEAVRGLAVAYQKLNKPDDAEQTFQRAISLRPNDWIDYNWLGQMYLEQGKLKEAEIEFLQVERLAPDSYVGYGNLGSTYLQAGNYSEAVPLLERATSIRPDASGTSNLANAYFSLRRFSDAARTFEKAVALDGDSDEVWGNLGDAYYWAPGERDKARPAYAKAIDLAAKALNVNPRDPSLLAYTAEYYAMSGMSAQAKTLIQRALALSPKTPEILLSAAIVYNQLGKASEALVYLGRAVDHGLPVTALRDTPNFDNLRNRSEFRSLVYRTKNE